eukprot:9231601-Alexandrium_andersonii.AAC.1
MQPSRSCDPQTARALHSEGATKPELRSAAARARALRQGCKANAEGCAPGGRLEVGPAGGAPGRPAGRAVAGAPWPSELQLGRRPPLGSVSYTHLRAHETSAHL